MRDLSTPVSRYVLVKENDSIVDFFEALLRTHDAEVGFVVDDQGRLRGIVTPIQLMNFCKVRLASGAEEMSSGELIKYLDAKEVKDIMLPAVSVRPEDTIRIALSLMIRHGLEAMPITDKDGKVLGDIDFMEIINYSLEKALKAEIRPAQ